MSGSVVFDSLVLFIALVSLIAASCIIAVVRKRWLLARDAATPVKKERRGFS